MLITQIRFNPNGIYHYRKHSDQNHIAIHQDIQKVIDKTPIWLNTLEKFYQKYQLFEKNFAFSSVFRA